MPRYNPERLIATIEQQLNDLSQEALPTDERVINQGTSSPLSTPTPPFKTVNTKQIFEEVLFPELGQHISVNKQMPNTRFGLMKKIYLKLFSPFLNRQATFNAQTAKVLELFNEQFEANQQLHHSYHAALLKEQNHRSYLEGKIEEKEQNHRSYLEGKIEEMEEVLDYLYHQNLENYERLEVFSTRISTLAEDVSCSIKTLQQSAATLTQNLAEHSDQLANQTTDFSLHRELMNSNIKKLTSVEQQVHDLQNHSNLYDKKFNELQAQQQVLIKADEASESLSWVPAAYKSIEQRMGSLEAETTILANKIKENLEFRALVASLVQRLKQDNLPTEEHTPHNLANADSSSNKPSVLENVLADFSSNLSDLAYQEFQLNHRGTIEQLKGIQQFYVELIENHLGTHASVQALDLGCGDGVFLQLLQEKGWNAIGVDKNHVMIEQAIAQGLQAQEQDLFEFLTETKHDSLTVLTAFQVIEHLKPASLNQLLRESMRVLQPGGLVLFETINPKTIGAHKWFHMDLTHEKLILPETLSWLCESIGFEVIEWKGIHPVEAESRLENPDGDANITKLNELLFGDQDYYFLARKPKASQ